MSKECVTHHFACDCREAEFRALAAENEKLRLRLEFWEKNAPYLKEETLLLANAELVEALREIVSYETAFTNWTSEMLKMSSLAQQALAKHGGK